jgi:glutamine amidotransferase PdxT
VDIGLFGLNGEVFEHASILHATDGLLD